MRTRYLPKDPAGYHAIVERIAAARAREEFLAVIPDAVAFEDDRFRAEFSEPWAQCWRLVLGTDPQDDAWPVPAASIIA